MSIYPHSILSGRSGHERLAGQDLLNYVSGGQLTDPNRLMLSAGYDNKYEFQHALLIARKFNR